MPIIGWVVKPIPELSSRSQVVEKLNDVQVRGIEDGAGLHVGPAWAIRESYDFFLDLSFDLWTARLQSKRARDKSLGG